MMLTPFPENYEHWKHCITVECGIPLSLSFVSQRLAVWRNEAAEETRRFRHLYGDDYWQMVIHWFERAEGELKAGA
jgi:hypothetical protein